MNESFSNSKNKQGGVRVELSRDEYLEGLKKAGLSEFELDREKLRFQKADAERAADRKEREAGKNNPANAAYEKKMEQAREVHRISLEIQRMLELAGDDGSDHVKIYSPEESEEIRQKLQ